jgi:hypothetical protein
VQRSSKRRSVAQIGCMQRRSDRVQRSSDRVQRSSDRVQRSSVRVQRSSDSSALACCNAGPSLNPGSASHGGSAHCPCSYEDMENLTRASANYE